MCPWHLWEVTESCVEWLCVVVLSRLLPEAGSLSGTGSWLVIVSMSSVEFLTEA